MQKIQLNPLFSGMSGKMGNIIFKTSKYGQTYIASRPKKSKAKPSQAQLDQRRAFGQASDYCKTALADETTRAFYETLAEVKHTPVRSLCMGDYLNEPTIDELDFSRYKGNVGDRILVMTSDDVGVVEVNVKITRADGTHIEKGKAVENGVGSGNWEYVATMPIPLGTDIFIEAEGFDRPGHRAVSSVNPIVGESHEYNEYNLTSRRVQRV